MRSINKVIIIGNVTRDPEVKRTMGDQYVATFGVATNRDWMTRDGRKEQSTEFHDIVCWGRLAEIVQDRLRKGNLVHIDGFLKTRSWDDTSGVKKFRTEIVAEDLLMLDRQQRREENSSTEIPAFGGPQEAPPSDQPLISIENPGTI